MCSAAGAKGDKYVVHAIVEGEVQGVGFRYTTERVAKELGVAGTVRNLPGGNVEIYAEASPAVLDAFFAALQTRTAGRVDAIHKEISVDPLVLPGFHIVH
jgi:acylphosphatase